MRFLQYVIIVIYDFVHVVGFPCLEYVCHAHNITYLYSSVKGQNEI